MPDNVYFVSVSKACKKGPGIIWMGAATQGDSRGTGTMSYSLRMCVSLYLCLSL